MSNQESQDQSNTTEKPAVNKKRRIMLGAGAVAPVALTLVSPSVFGVECLSQQMSGNTSHHGAGSCTLGSGPLAWLANTSWPAPYVHGTPNGKSCNYQDGTAFNVAFPGDTTTIMAEILCNYNKPNPTANETILAYFVAAILNAQTAGYVMTASEVRELRVSYLANACPGPSCTSMPPGYASVEQFLLSTFSTL